MRASERILRAGLFHLWPYGLEIVCGRHHWEQQNQNAGESQPTTTGLLARPRTIFGDAPNPEGGECQQKPDKIEQQFHV